MELTGESVKRFEESFVPTKDYECILIGLTRDRDELYQRINARVDKMISLGLVEEVVELQSRGLSEKYINARNRI